MKAEILYLIEGTFENDYFLYLKVGEETFRSSKQHTIQEWEDLLGQSLKGIPRQDR